MTAVGIVTGAARGMGFECARRITSMVDHLLVVDRDADGVQAAAGALASGGPAMVTPFALDITDHDGVAALADRAAEVGTLRAVAHVAGISPTMADWRRILEVDLVGTAALVHTLRPLAATGTAMVCFASMAAQLADLTPDPAVAEVLDDALDERFLDRLREAVGPAIEHPGVAYAWAKHGVQRLVRREAVRLGPAGARICSVSPGIIDTPQGQQEAAHNPSMTTMLQASPLGRAGRPAEVAAVVAFVLSDEASYLNAVDLLVDGGICAGIANTGIRHE